MATKNDDLKKKTGAEMRAQREQRQQADPAYEAKRREASFLKNLTNARDDYDWIVNNKAWTQLGYETHTEWYAARVHPLLLALGARPTPELSASILDHIEADEANLAGPQRMTQAEKAELAGVSRKTLSRRSQDQPQGTMSPGSDLASTAAVDPFDSIPDEAKARIAERLAEQAAVGETPHLPQEPPIDRSEPQRAAGVADDPSRAGDGEGRSEPGHPDAPGETGDADMSSSAPPPAAGPGSGGETGPEVPTSQAPSGPVDGREQPGPAGVPDLAAPAPAKTFEDVLDEHVPDGDPHQKWRASFLKAIRQSYALSSFAVNDIATNGNELCFDELINLRDFMDGLLSKVQAKRVELKKQAEAELPGNVTPIRRTA